MSISQSTCDGTFTQFCIVFLNESDATSKVVISNKEIITLKCKQLNNPERLNFSGLYDEKML